MDLDFSEIRETIIQYLYSLQDTKISGKFYPVQAGATDEGLKISLGFSCFALKIFYILGLWDTLPKPEKNAWIHFILSYQKTDLKNPCKSCLKNAFIDDAMLGYFHDRLSIREKFSFNLSPCSISAIKGYIFAETKQTIATLEQVGFRPSSVFSHFPKTPYQISRFLASLDWSNPWNAGGQSSAVAFFLVMQGPDILNETEIKNSKEQIHSFFSGIVDPVSGTYFFGEKPDKHLLINGAMKILSALDWLQFRIHYPEKLIDTCLNYTPPSDGCCLVDVLYNLYRCSRETNYRNREIQDYCSMLLDEIMRHQNPDGGFSYFIGKSQVEYYGYPISHGKRVSDIHGTCLLTWALAMIDIIMNGDKSSWKTIKP